jgi:hypothetical protein
MSSILLIFDQIEALNEVTALLMLRAKPGGSFEIVDFWNKILDH